MYHGVTLGQAALYLAHRRRRERAEEFRRQMLYEVINRSAGGEFEADRGLLRDEGAEVPERGGLAGWVRLSEMLGCPVPDAARGKNG